jgi:oligopeptide/dipeptide ABC transporter ATP-binding protein
MGLLVVDGLVTELKLREGRVRVVDDVSFDLERGSTLAIVGESGCGKSMLALSLMGILPQPLARIASGAVVFDGEDLAQAAETRLRSVRGKEIAMIFQDPSASLNPVETIGSQIVEAILEHEAISGQEARSRALDLLHLVRIPDADKRIDDYPHRLSGGMCQRVMIAMAIACRPKLLIADEPTTALDVTIQAQILALLKKVQIETGTAILLITHNLAIVASSADAVLVMYAGKIVESGSVQDVFRDARHPYTAGLLSAIPAGIGPVPKSISRLTEIPGTVPTPGHKPLGCSFEPRCTRAITRCRREIPALLPLSSRHSAACFVAQMEAGP